MNSSELNVAIGLVVLTVGIALFLLPFTGAISSLDLGVPLLLLGVLVAGIGMGTLANTSTIRKLETKLEQEQSRKNRDH